MTTTEQEIQRCQDEQRDAAEHIAAHGADRYAAMWLADWFTEELLIERGGDRA